MEESGIFEEPGTFPFLTGTTITVRYQIKGQPIFY